MEPLQIKGDYFHGSFHLASDNPYQVINKTSPANTDHFLWEVPTHKTHVPKVISSAQQGFKNWKTKTATEKKELLKKYQEIVLSKKETIARSIALETGKPYWEALTEVTAVIGKVDITLNDSFGRIQTKTYDNIAPQTQGTVTYKPLGVCLVIGPFNFPCHLANGQILSALMAGNSIIYKPSEKTIHSAQLLIECFHEAGFPAGVINFINGGADIATELLKERSIKGIYFTGSKEVGVAILKQTHKDLSKLVALELGGKNTTILHKDAQVDQALAELLRSCFLTSGQRCTATSRVAIHASLKDEVIGKFHDLAKKLIIDHPIEYEHEPFMGPLVDAKSLDNYLLYMGMAKREGFDEVMRGKALEKKHPGYYVSPSIHYADKLPEQNRFFNSEIFGPNCTFIPYQEIEEAIYLANQGEYGLSGAVFTQDQALFQHCLDSIEAGIFNWNRSTVGASSKLPFGGVKGSGNYRPAGVSMIDACAYPVASLQQETLGEVDWDQIKGIGI